MGDEADDRETGDRDLDQLQPLRDNRLVKRSAIWPPSADRKK